jgi:PPOX class probable F420-dependent enzyme
MTDATNSASQSGFGPFPNLGTSSVVILTTFRRDGRAVPSPVWYARRGDRLIVATHRSTGKLKRIRAGLADAQDARGARVLVAPGTYSGKVTGDAREGYAQLVGPGEASAALAAVRARYGLLGRLLFGLNSLRRKPLDTAIEIVPA